MTHYDDNLSVVIPVLNAGKYLPNLLPALFAQEPAAPGEVILVDSNSSDDTRAVAARFDRVRVIPAGKFSHGRARNLGVREARGAWVILMTQDALPVGPDWLARLLEPFNDATVAATFSRQVPYEDANPMESFFLSQHFPDGEPSVRRREAGRPLAFHDVFFSNVSAAYRRDLLLSNPFDEDLIMSEDQQLSRDLLNAGYAVVYQPRSVVRHSHDYSLLSVFRRYFDSVYSIRVLFPAHGMGQSASIGMSYLQREFRYIRTEHPRWLPYYGLYTVAKTLGTVTGHCTDWLPRPVIRWCSMHRYHWDEPSRDDAPAPVRPEVR